MRMLDDGLMDAIGAAMERMKDWDYGRLAMVAENGKTKVRRAAARIMLDAMVGKPRMTQEQTLISVCPGRYDRRG